MDDREENPLIHKVSEGSPPISESSIDEVQGVSENPNISKTVGSPPRRAHFMMGDIDSVPTSKVDLLYHQVSPVSEENQPNIVLALDLPDQATKPTDDPEVGKSAAPTRSVAFEDNKECKQLLIELFEFKPTDVDTQLSWQETARWVKYEEDVEGADRHWGRAHVPFLSFHSLLQLRRCIEKGAVELNTPPLSFPELCRLIADSIGEAYSLTQVTVASISAALGHKHLHVEAKGQSAALATVSTVHTALSQLRRVATSRNIQEDRSKPEPDSSTKMSHTKSKPTSFSRAHSAEHLADKPMLRSKTQPALVAAQREKNDFMRNLAEDVELAQVLVGELPELKRPKMAIIRFTKATIVNEVSEDAPLRYVFVILGPALVEVDFHEIGRSMATLLADQTFHAQLDESSDRSELLASVDAFLERSLVLPTGNLDSGADVFSVREANKAIKRKQERLKSRRESRGRLQSFSLTNGATLKRREPLHRTKRWFGGAWDDIKDRWKHYGKDFVDALNVGCITSVVFVLCAAFAPAITFGGLMSEYTNQTMGICEMLISQCIGGIMWSLLSAQPLIIQSATGPVLIFEAALYNTLHEHPIRNILFYSTIREDCFAHLGNDTLLHELHNHTHHENNIIHDDDMFNNNNNMLIDNNNSSLNMSQLVHCDDQYINVCDRTNQPNTALWTLALTLLTFCMACLLKHIRTSVYFGRTMRQLLGDFGVFISIVLVSSVDLSLFPNVYVKRVEMPHQFGFTNPTNRGAGVLVPWYADSVMVYLFAIVPAFLLFILLFVETQITELLLLKKSRGLRRGTGGHHWDMMIVALITLVSGMFGLPWMCAAAVQSIAHVNSLTVYNKHVPGERASIKYVVEQRVTALVVAVCIGGCAFAGHWLQALPVAVLFGVFLYLGVMNLNGTTEHAIQFVKRIALLAIPEKYFPDTAYCQEVSMWRMHSYTALQVVCLLVVLVVKAVQAMAFPFVLLLMSAVRWAILPYIYTQHQLEALDGHEETHEDGTDEVDVYDLVNVIT